MADGIHAKATRRGERTNADQPAPAAQRYTQRFLWPFRGILQYPATARIWHIPGHLPHHQSQGAL
eukprot:8454136-Alexandrium_andersonii.AAC.1